VHYWIKY